MSNRRRSDKSPMRSRYQETRFPLKRMLTLHENLIVRDERRHNKTQAHPASDTKRPQSNGGPNNHNKTHVTTSSPVDYQTSTTSGDIVTPRQPLTARHQLGVNPLGRMLSILEGIIAKYHMDQMGDASNRVGTVPATWPSAPTNGISTTSDSNGIQSDGGEETMDHDGQTDSDESSDEVVIIMATNGRFKELPSVGIPPQQPVDKTQCKFNRIHELKQESNNTPQEIDVAVRGLIQDRLLASFH